MVRTFTPRRHWNLWQYLSVGILGTLLLASSAVYAQKAGNEWISYGQTYVKLLVWEDGVYRVRANAVGLSSLLGSDPSRLQLYLRGQEVPIFLINRGNPNAWDADDYLEFYAERNSGADDAELFKNLSTGLPEPQSQTNDRVSLFTDTAAYFLTAGSQPGLRYRVNTDADYNNLTPRTHYTHTYLLNFSNCTDPRCDQVYRFANGGIYDVNTQLNSDYIGTEGYAGQLNTNVTNYNLPTNDVYTVGNLTYSLNVRMLAARSIARHDWELQVGPQRQIFTFSPQVGIGVTLLNMSGPTSELTEGFTPFSTTPLNTGFGLSSYRYSYIELKYPRQFRFGNAQTAMMEVSAPALTRSLLQLQNFGHTAGDSVLLFDVTNAVRVRASLTGSTARAILPKGSGNVQRVYATTGSQIREPLVQAARFAGFNNTALGAEFLIITHDKFLNSANAYALYRDTNTVNPLRTRVVTVQDLYDEFGYGNPTPLALKRAMNYALTNWQLKPKFLMLWGKGSFARRNNGFNYVPTWNAPATDYEYVTNFDPARRELVPKIGVGRMNIMTDEQGLLYLEKIDIYEHTPYEEWMKEAVHLGGGAELNEQKVIRDYLENARKFHEGAPHLGRVFSQFKVSNNVLDQSDDTDVRQAINQGVGMLTFFGHSTSNIFDVNLKDAYFYENWNKFPFILANGCYSGDFASNSSTFGERFLLEQTRDAQGRLRGGIGFLSSTTTGFLTTMGVYTDIFYEVAFRDSIGRPISNIIIETKRRMEAHSGQSQSTINHIKQINLQCDPSLRLYAPTRPDLWVDNRSIVPRTEQVTASAESLVVRVGLNNRGLQIDTAASFNVKLTLSGSNISLTAPVQRRTGVNFPGRTDSLTFVFQPGSQTLAGLLTLKLEVDPDGELAEISEANNIAELSFVLPGTLPSILYPTDFAVINREQPSLQAALIGQTLGETTFEFEIDSSWRFDSPLYTTLGRSGPVTGPAYQVSWPLPFSLREATVYYWRVRRVGGADGTNSEWITASFQYRAGAPTGWAQARPPQFFDLQTNGVNVEVSTERWQFGTIRKIVDASINVGEPAKITLINPPSLEEGRTFPLSTGGLNGILYTVIDGINLRPQTYNPNLGNLDILSTSGGAVNNLAGVVQAMRKGDYLVALGVGNPNVPLWRDATFDALNQVGVSNAIRQLASGNRFVLLGRKGQQPGSAIELLSANLPNNQWLLQENIYGSAYRGTARTRTIGPAKRWDNLIWDFTRSESSLNDDVDVIVYGIRENGSEVRLLTTANPGSYDLRNYSATTYPYLRLEAVLKDSLLRSAPQLDNWYVYYQPVPDAALDPNANLVIQPQVVQEGRNLQVGFTVRNLTPYNMDSLLVHYLVSSSTQPQRVWLARKVAPLPGDSILYVDQLLNTDGLAGDCRLTIHINPGNAQPELNQFNNLLSAPFEVLPDRMNPVLDVTFDGRHIRNLELVRPSPVIDIMAYDENDTYLLDDTSNVEVYLKGARDFSPARRVFYSSGQLTFTPATAQNPKARVRYIPGQLRDSLYQLEVQVVDRRGNRSGSVPYRIQFQVESQASLSNVLAVPNPFSDFTRFSYRLTGTDIPAKFLLEFYHPSGRLVRTIDLAQLGEVYIGDYITQFAWDGTDQNGNRLDNGVYSYRITASLPNGQALPIRNAQTGEYFPDGWGKVAILR